MMNFLLFRKLVNSREVTTYWKESWLL